MNKQKTDRPLISLEEHNKSMILRHEDLVKPKPNGIACPVCGEEMFDDASGIVLASNPAQTRIYCDSCQFEGLRY